MMKIVYEQASLSSIPHVHISGNEPFFSILLKYHVWPCHFSIVFPCIKGVKYISSLLLTHLCFILAILPLTFCYWLCFLCLLAMSPCLVSPFPLPPPPPLLSSSLPLLVCAWPVPITTATLSFSSSFSATNIDFCCPLGSLLSPL